MSLNSLFKTMPQVGRIRWIGIREEKYKPLTELEEAQLSTNEGLIGDRYNGQSKKRQVTLIQAEHLEVVGQILDQGTIHPGSTRRNIVVSGINLLAFKDQEFEIGDQVVLAMTGICHPCSRMEENLGPGGYNALRGHSGINATVIKGGVIRIGDAVRLKL